MANLNSILSVMHETVAIAAKLTGSVTQYGLI